MNFSQRIGKEPIKTELEKNGLSNDLRNSLWTLIIELIINKENTARHYYYNGENHSKLDTYFRALWVDFFKRPIDNLHRYSDGTIVEDQTAKEVRDWYFNADWNKAFDFIEFTSSYHEEFQEKCNHFLKKEMSAYRFVDEKLVQINSKEEIIELETALNIADKFSPAKTHLKQAIKLLSDRKNRLSKFNKRIYFGS